MTAAASKYTPTRPCVRKDSGKRSGATVATTLYPNAAPTPVPISVHMFGLRFAIDCAQRWKNGQPAHSTTGAESASSSQVRAAVDRNATRCPSMASASTIADSGRVHQKRRRKSTSSGFSSSSRLGIIGSSAMPQIGQVPGPSRTIPGCIGQVYLAPAGLDSPGSPGARAIPSLSRIPSMHVGRAWHRAVRTEHAAIAGFGPEYYAALSALVEPLTGISRHCLSRYVPALRTGECRLDGHSVNCVHLLNFI